MPIGRSSVGAADAPFCSRPSGCAARPRAPSRGSRQSARDRPGRAALQPRHVLGHRIENAAAALHVGEPLRRRAAVAEQPLEDHARIVLGRQRRRRRPPRQRVHVDAAVAVLAVADQVIQIERELERRQRRCPCRARRQSTDRPSSRCGRRRLRCASGARRSATCWCRECDRRRRRRAPRRWVAQAADDDHLIAERRQRREDRRQLEIRARAAGFQ